MAGEDSNKIVSEENDNPTKKTSYKNEKTVGLVQGLLEIEEERTKAVSVLENEIYLELSKLPYFELDENGHLIFLSKNPLNLLKIPGALINAFKNSNIDPEIKKEINDSLGKLNIM